MGISIGPVPPQPGDPGWYPGPVAPYPGTPPAPTSMPMTPQVAQQSTAPQQGTTPGGAQPQPTSLAAAPVPPQPAPPQNFGQRWGNFAANNGNMLMGLGAGLMDYRRNPQQSPMSNAFQGAMIGQKADQQKQQINATVEYLVNKGIPREQAVALVRGGNSQLLKEALKSNGSGNDTTDWKNYQNALATGFKGSFTDFKRVGVARSGTTVIWGRKGDKDVPFLATSDGQLVEAQLPEGVTMSEPLKTIETPTKIFVTGAKSGRDKGVIDKDIAGAAEQQAGGKGQGEAADAYRSMSSKMPGLEKVVGDLDKLSEQATYTWSGQMTDAIRRQAGAEPRESAIARQTYISMVDNQILPLLRDTFGAQFTEREGQSLKATLGDPDKHPKEKQAVLNAFIEQKRRDVEALARRVGGEQGGGGAPADSAGGGAVPEGVTPDQWSVMTPEQRSLWQ